MLDWTETRGSWRLMIVLLEPLLNHFWFVAGRIILQCNIHMDGTTQVFIAEDCPKNHIASTSLPSLLILLYQNKHYIFQQFELQQVLRWVKPHRPVFTPPHASVSLGYYDSVAGSPLFLPWTAWQMLTLADWDHSTRAVDLLKSLHLPTFTAFNTSSNIKCLFAL